MHQNIESLDEDLRSALKNEGATVFDWLVEIIKVHGRGGDEADDNVELVLS